ncbi:Monocarboxylate transporter 12 [Portunus trituberculatus]|uniref:Monocarboxylate transporter 12 n=1 Tax=Portunus trituberculatus TaxID=210409 RepID=A0A5B7EYE7_PORTR|nr:Monocarboxylate transporter 12 [Portunus trituberculatus]
MAGLGSCEGVLLQVLAPWALAPSPPPSRCPSQHHSQSQLRFTSPCLACSGDTIGGSSVPLVCGVTPGPFRTSCPAAPWSVKLTRLDVVSGPVQVAGMDDGAADGMGAGDSDQDGELLYSARDARVGVALSPSKAIPVTVFGSPGHSPQYQHGLTQSVGVATVKGSCVVPVSQEGHGDAEMCLAGNFSSLGGLGDKSGGVYKEVPSSCESFCNGETTSGGEECISRTMVDSSTQTGPGWEEGALLAARSRRNQGLEEAINIDELEVPEKRTQDLGLSPDPSMKDLGGRSPCTPTSGCLKAGTRAPSGAHVQFHTPYDKEEDEEQQRLLHDTLVTQGGQVTLKKAPCGASTPNNGDQLPRLLTKLPDTSPSEINSSLSLSKKWRGRHISGSSSLSLGSSSSSSGNSGATELERRAPDGGWGWVIVAASFMVHCIADGITMSFGVFFVELLNYFNEGKSLTSWVGSLFMAIPLLAGPLASILTDRYGCQTVTICGALVACLGFFVSAFVNTIPMLLLTVGVITGLGLAVCYVAAIVIVAFYFEKKRSLATGIAVAGSGIGTFLFAPLIQYLMDHWGWRLSFILLAGVMLNMVVCGALMRDLEWTPRHSSSTNRNVRATPAPSSHRGSTSHSSETVGVRGGNLALPSLDELRRLVQSGDVAALLSPEEHPAETLRGSASMVLLPTFLSRSHALPPDVIPCLSSRTNAYEVVSQMYPHLLSHSLSSTLEQVLPQGEKKSQKSQTHKEKMSEYASTTITSIGSSGGYSQDPRAAAHPQSRLLPPATFLSHARQSMTYRGAMLNIQRYRLRASSCPDIYRNSIITIAKAQDEADWTYLDDMGEMLTACVDVTYCMDASYLVFAVSNFVLYVFYDTVYMYLTDYAQGVGISADDSANLISVIGILNCLGMVVMGYVGDRSWSSPVLIYNISMVVCGLSVLVMPFITNYWLLALASAVFGLFISANYALTSVIVVELVSLEAFSKAYGLLLLIQGLANLIGPPLVGFIADTTGSYVMPFVVSGLFIVFCGLILNLIPLIKRCRGQYSSSTSSPVCTPKNGSPTATPLHNFKQKPKPIQL